MLQLDLFEAGFEMENDFRARGFRIQVLLRRDRMQLELNFEVQKYHRFKN